MIDTNVIVSNVVDIIIIDVYIYMCMECDELLVSECSMEANDSLYCTAVGLDVASFMHHLRSRPIQISFQLCSP